jgi:hypothetical protein
MLQFLLGGAAGFALARWMAPKPPASSGALYAGKVAPQVKTLAPVADAHAQPALPAAIAFAPVQRVNVAPPAQAPAQVLPPAQTVNPMHADVLDAFMRRDAELLGQLRAFLADRRLFDFAPPPVLWIDGPAEFQRRTGRSVSSLRDNARRLVTFSVLTAGDSNDPGAVLRAAGSADVWLRTDDDRAVSLIRAWIDNRLAAAQAFG